MRAVLVVVVTAMILLIACSRQDSSSSYVVGETQKISADDGQAGDHFGFSAAISYDWVIAGAQHDEENGIESGSASLYHWDGSAWAEKQKITPSDRSDNNWFGLSVSISGDWAVVGACQVDGGRGAAYLFHREGTGWVERQKIAAGDGREGDRFGWSVSISGNKIIVGAYKHNNDAGAAYLFHRNGSRWVEIVKIAASDGFSGDWFGLTAGISGDRAIVGACQHNDYKGAAYIFQWNGSSWTEQQKITREVKIFIQTVT